MVCYSPYPCERYTVPAHPGAAARVGLGALPVFGRQPGLWNLYWLSTDEMDALLDWPYSAKAVPLSSAWLPACEMTLQQPVAGRRVADWLTELPALPFLNTIAPRKTELLLYRRGGERWWAFALARALMSSLTRTDHRAGPPPRAPRPDPASTATKLPRLSRRH